MLNLISARHFFTATETLKVDENVRFSKWAITRAKPTMRNHPLNKPWSSDSEMIKVESNTQTMGIFIKAHGWTVDIFRA